MKKIIFLVLLASVVMFAQDDYVSVDNSVYNFLQRMEALHIIHNYNSFETPKPRKDIVRYLKQAIASEDKLDYMDKQILNDLKTEFEYELYGTLNNSQSLIGSGDYKIFSQNNKYLYYMSNPDKSSLFINLLGEGEAINQNDKSTNQNLSTTLGIIGGDIRGTFLDHFGFVLKATNGDVFGNREVAKLRPDIAQNFKYNLDPAAAFFDETEGYLTADYKMFRFKFGRERMRIGYGPFKSIIDDNAPPFDYIGFNIKYHFFTFSYFHGQLLGNSYFQPDSINGGIQVVDQKYIGYHRIGFNLSDAVNFGAGEIIIYGDRPLDLSYLNPFAFYKSVEHSNQDRDNSLLFFDFNNKSIEGLKIYSTLLIDDIDFSKIGTAWYGNETLFDLGLYSANLYKFFPLDIKLEYTRVDPYVHTHRTGNSNFTNLGYNLGSTLQPNSELFLGELGYQFTYRLKLTGSFAYILHGANPVGPNGTIINVGGDETLGHRVFDSNNARLLDGDLEYSRITTASLSYEPFRQIFISIKIIYYNESLQNSVKNNQFQSYFDISARL